MTNIQDALAIFNLREDYTLDTLKREYIKLIKDAHPDKGGNPQIFKMISSAYDLLRKHKDTVVASHNQMREAATNISRSETAPPPININAPNFQNEFNRYFEENKATTPYDKGYGGIMADRQSDWQRREEINIDRTINNMNDFHQQFMQRPLTKASKKIVKYRDPEGMDYGAAYSIIGQGNIKNFSSDQASSLNYSDYKQAFEVEQLVDPADLERVQTRDIHQLKAERENMGELSADEKRRMEKAMMREARREKERTINAQRELNGFLR
jgi:curved DNA-binding protein CbpA